MRPAAEQATRYQEAWVARSWIAAGTLALLLVVGLTVRDEARASGLQARYFTRQASQLTNEVVDGPSDRIRFPKDGPYDRRFGYARLPELVLGGTQHGFHIAAQARVSEGFAATVDRGVAPIFHEKAQAGLRILDRRGAVVFDAPHPQRAYPSFAAVPPAVWQTLLFLENRTLLDPRYPSHNPSVDWSRMAQAGADYALRWLGSGRSVPGASTLATQLEKLRHSPDGRTRSTREKVLQMEAAALRSYLGGENTEDARRRIVADYLNSVPLAAIAGYGEVTGLSDGLWAWYGADVDDVNRLLWQDSAAGWERAVAYRQVLSLMLAHRRPSYLLLKPAGREELRTLTDQHLRLMTRAGIISAPQRDAALAVDLTLRTRAPVAPRASFIERKGANAVRMDLLGLTGVKSLYELDRLDLTARTTLDFPAQQAVTRLLEQLTDPGFIRQRGLSAPGLLRRGDPARVLYAVALYEHTATGNVVRVQADNGDVPFDMVEGSKLELGSTAKLRTLISYLEIVEQLYLYNAGRPPVNLRAEPVGAGDGITAWTLAYLASDPGASLARVLEAAMSRPYSASPGETFTGGATYTFRNTDTTDDHRAPSVREAFIRSVNLPFIRIMRDIVHYYLYRLPGSMRLLLVRPGEVPWDADAARLADGEGRALMERFYEEQADSAVWRGRSATQLAWVYRTVAPQAGLAAFADFMREHLAAAPSDARMTALYDGSDPTGLAILDRAHLADVPPLALWLAAYLGGHPDAPLQEVLDASNSIRQEIAGAPLRPVNPRAPKQWVTVNSEGEAFREIQRSWERLGYPFGSLAPSYGSAIGSAADRPDHLAELAGIVLTDGVRYPVRLVEELHYAVGTPYETLLRRSPVNGERVLSSEIAAVVRSAMLAVVTDGGGTARGVDGSPLPIGAKTGTGNNRYLGRAVDRTASVVFFVGDRFYGTITALVSGPVADRYDFTSALPVQILKMLGPTFAHLEP